MNIPLFSIIIPVHNKATHVQRSILSVLNQTLTNFELIIINDASTDNSLQKIKQIEDPRIKLLGRDTPGPGGYAARNLGIENALGEFIAFLDADDEYYPEHLYKITEVIKQFSNINIFSCAYELKHGNSIKKNGYYNKHRNYLNHIITDFFEESANGRSPIHTNTIVIRKSILQTSELFPAGKCKRGGDIETWMRLAIDHKIAWSAHIGAIYHKDSENMVTKTISDVEIQYIYFSVKKLLAQVSKEMGFKLKKYSNYYMKMSILHAIVQNQNPKEIIKGFFPEADHKLHFMFRALMLIPSFLLKFLFKQYRKLMVRYSKSEV